MRSTPPSAATRISAAPAPRKGPTNDPHIITHSSIGPGSSGPTSSRWPPSSAPRNTTTYAAVDHPRPRRGRRPAGRPDRPHPRRARHPRAVPTWPAPRRRSAAAGRPRRSRPRRPAPVAGGAPALADQVAAEADRLRRIAVAARPASSPTSSTGWPSSSPSPAPESSQDFADRLDVHERDLLRRPSTTADSAMAAAGPPATARAKAPEPGHSPLRPRCRLPAGDGAGRHRAGRGVVAEETPP